MIRKKASGPPCAHSHRRNCKSEPSPANKSCSRFSTAAKPAVSFASDQAFGASEPLCLFSETGKSSHACNVASSASLAGNARGNAQLLRWFGAGADRSARAGMLFDGIVFRHAMQPPEDESSEMRSVYEHTSMLIERVSKMLWKGCFYESKFLDGKPCAFGNRSCKAAASDLSRRTGAGKKPDTRCSRFLTSAASAQALV